MSHGSQGRRPPPKKRPISLRRQIAAVRHVRSIVYVSDRHGLVSSAWASRRVAELDAAIETLTHVRLFGLNEGRPRRAGKDR